MPQITAKGTFRGHELNDLPVLNPGDWFGRTWLIEIGGSYCPLFLVVEADSVWSAIEELAENEQFGHNIVVADDDLGDYPEEDRTYGPSGQVLDLDHLMVHGSEDADRPFPCRYFGQGLPSEGIEPAEIENFDLAEADGINNDHIKAVAEVLASLATIPLPSLGIDLDAPVGGFLMLFKRLVLRWQGSLFGFGSEAEQAADADLATLKLCCERVIVVSSADEKVQAVCESGVSVFISHDLRLLERIPHDRMRLHLLA